MTQFTNSLSGRTSASANPRTQPAPRTLARCFLDSIYGTQRGYAELSYVDGDPRYKALSRYVKVGYFAWPARASDLEAEVTYLTAQGFNVYVSSGLYEARDRKSPLPSCVVFLDDAPAAPALPYSMTVQTSEGSQHAYYLLDAPISPDERRELQRRAAAANSSDASGADVEQIVRPPETINTKGHKRYSVSLTRTNGSRYTAEQLRAAWPAIEPTARQRAARDVALSLDSDLWQRAAFHLANIEALLVSGHVRAIRPATQAARILADEMLSYVVKGNTDDSRSMNGCVLAHGLRAYGFTNEEIAAVLYHKYTKWGLVAEKGSAWAQADIEACITHAIAQYPNIVASPTRYSAQRESTPIAVVAPAPLSRARKDRPAKIADTSDLLRQLAPLQDTPGKVCKDRKELAAALGVCAKTLDRKLAPLIESGAAEWVFYNQRQESYLRLSEALEMLSTRSQTPTAPAAIVAHMDVWTGTGSDRTTTPETTISPRDIEGTHGAPLVPCVAVVPAAPTSDDATSAPMGNDAPQPAQAGAGGRVCPPQTSPAGALPSLRECIGEALDAYGAKRKAVLAHVRMLTGQRYEEKAIERAYEAERDRRALMRKIERETQRLATSDLEALRAQRNNARNKIAEATRVLPASASKETCERQATVQKQIEYWRGLHKRLTDLIEAKIAELPANPTPHPKRQRKAPATHAQNSPSEAPSAPLRDDSAQLALEIPQLATEARQIAPPQPARRFAMPTGDITDPETIETLAQYRLLKARYGLQA